MNMRSIRGAITVELNDEKQILDETKKLLNTIIEKNNVNIEDIVSIFFTMTKDLDKVYPAKSARELGITEAGLFCTQELYVENSLEKCIRVLLHINSYKSQKDMKHIYLKEAKKLRLDLLDER